MTSTKPSTRRSRSRRQKQVKLVLTERDIDILKAIRTYRFLTSGQLTKLFFTSKSKADRRLRSLFDHGYLDRLERPVVRGKSELLYALWKEGARTLLQSDGQPGAGIAWKPSRNRIKPDHMQHELDIIEFRLALDRSLREETSIRMLVWISQTELKIQKDLTLMMSGGRQGGRLRLLPDAFFALGTPKGKTAFFLEIDRGTEAAASVFRNKLLAYQVAYEQGIVQKLFGYKSFRVLTVANTRARVESLLRVASRLRYPIMFWFSELEVVRTGSVTESKLWQNNSAGFDRSPLCG